LLLNNKNKKNGHNVTQIILQVLLIAAYLAAHVLFVGVAVILGLQLLGSTEWLISKVNDTPSDIDRQKL
tara:strand:+ start:2203 stop:2409 length:207 start_codon:yes stop_codon:yes gene_type:complete